MKTNNIPRFLSRAGILGIAITGMVAGTFTACTKADTDSANANTKTASTDADRSNANSDQNLPESYQKIIAEYKDCKKHFTEDFDYDKYPNCAVEALGEYAEEGSGDLKVDLYYCQYDLNKDGKEELLIGGVFLDDDVDTNPTVLGFFEDNGDGSADSLLEVNDLSRQQPFGYEFSVQPTDKGLYVINVEAADEGILLCSMDENNKAQCDSHYTFSYDDNDNISYTADDGSVYTEEEFTELTGQELTFDWTAME